MQRAVDDASPILGAGKRPSALTLPSTTTIGIGGSHGHGGANGRANVDDEDASYDDEDGFFRNNPRLGDGSIGGDGFMLGNPGSKF